MNNPLALPVNHTEEDSTPSARLDRTIHGYAGHYTFGLSPISLTLAFSDWAMHLTSSPGRQMELANLALEQSLKLSREALKPKEVKDTGLSTLMAMPFKALQSSMQATGEWWQSATQVRGVSPHHQHMTSFFIKQMFDVADTANWPASNPEILRTAIATGGTSLLRGEQNFLADLRAQQTKTFQTEHRTGTQVHFQVGKNLAITPGTVVYRNHLIELIQYSPQTTKVYAEPILIVPSWILKYYILDLSEHNSLVRYLVQQGHTVYILSWHNPDQKDRNDGMEDYLQMGVFDALIAISKISGKTPIHTAGYCLGGTLLSIAAAALARPAQVRDADLIPEIKSVTLLAAQTDFSEPGEMDVLIDDSQVEMIEGLMSESGFMTGAQMAGSFQFLNSRDLIWSKRLREYMLGVRDVGNDMMSWNADVTRLPARMHGEYLHKMFLENALAQGRYQVEQHSISLTDIGQPMFVVGTARDTVSPWRSVYKIQHLTETDVTFLLASGGHNAGIVSEPGHPKRSYQVHTHKIGDAAITPDSWQKKMPVVEGSWWPEWHDWLASHSSNKQNPPNIPADMVLCKAPGTYVFKRFVD